MHIVQKINQKIRVGVLMGGRNCENEVSFNSGRTVCDHLDTERFEVVPVFQTFSGQLYILPYHFLHRGKISDFEHRLVQEAQAICWDDLKNVIDFAYLSMHGRNAEDGTLQGMLELLQIPYLGAKVFGSAMGMDKIIQRQMLQIHGIAVPKALVVTRDQILNLDTQIDLIQQNLHLVGLGLPLVIKPHKEGSSLGVSIVKDLDQLKAAIYQAAYVHANLVQAVLIEEYLVGMEFSCIIVEDVQGQDLVFSPTEIELERGSDLFDYQQKYMRGRATKHTPARCSTANLEKIKSVCQRVKQILRFDTIARIDGFLMSDGAVYVIDPNSLSGMGPTTFMFLQAAEFGISHTDLINLLITRELARYGYLLDLESKTKKMHTNKIRVGVVLGGASNERETSLESGRNVIYKLSPEKYQAIPLFLNQQSQLYQINDKLLVRNSTQEIMSGLVDQEPVLWSDLPKLVDFVFIALHGGIGENGILQGALETLGLPYNGSGVFASALCMNKYETNQFLQAAGFNVPQNYLVAKTNWQTNQVQELAKIEQKLVWPVVCKPHDDGCSVMVQKAGSATELMHAIELILNTGKEFVLIEEMITGMELTVGVLGNENPQALPPSQTIAVGGILSVEEKFLPGAGENQTPAPLPATALKFVQVQIEQIFKAAKCRGYARIDCFYQDALISPTGDERVVLIEINTLPGLTPATCLFHQAAEVGIKPMELIDQIITLGFAAHQQADIQDCLPACIPEVLQV